MTEPTPTPKKSEPLDIKTTVFVGIMAYVTILSIMIFLLIIFGFERSIPIVAGVYAGFGALVGVLYGVFKSLTVKIDKIATNTNGNLSRANQRAENAEAELKTMTTLYIKAQAELDANKQETKNVRKTR